MANKKSSNASSKQSTVDSGSSNNNSKHVVHNEKKSKSYSLSAADKFGVVWLALSGWIHIVMEGTWAWNNRLIQGADGTLPRGPAEYWPLFGSKLPSSNGIALNALLSFVEFLKSLWKSYSCGDSRYALSDTFILSVESITAAIDGPLCFFVVYAICYRRAWRHPLQLLLCTLQLFGLALYFLTEHIDNYSHCKPESIKCHYFYYWFFNLLWFFIPIMLWYQSYSAIISSIEKLSNVEGKKKEKGGKFFFFVKLFVFANLLGFSLIAFGTFGSHYLDEFLEGEQFKQFLHNNVKH